MEITVLLKYFNCQTNDSENKQIMSWLADDPDGSHKEEYKSARMIYNGMILNVTKEIPKKQNVLPTSRPYRKILWAVSSIAASILLMSGIFHFAQHEVLDEYSSKYLYAEVPDGQTFELVLEDGTSMFMNSGTEVKYPLAFARKDRKVEVLKGEVLFDVAHDSKRPFIVKTFAADVHVLGTSFDIQAYPKENYFSATLIRGKVDINNNITGEVCTLLPSMTAVCRGSDMVVVENVNTKDASSWTEGLLNLESMDFRDIMTKFERAFGVNIDIRCEKIPDLCFSRGKIRVSDGIEHALNILKMAADFNYERNFQTNTIIIR